MEELIEDEETGGNACPECGHTNLAWEYTCHTWQGGMYADGTPKWMSCQGCDSAMRLFCSCYIEEGTECDCEWTYTKGLNTDNPHWAHNERGRPGWLLEKNPVDRSRFWEDHESDMTNAVYRKRFILESCRIAVVDAVVNVCKILRSYGRR